MSAAAAPAAAVAAATPGTVSSVAASATTPFRVQLVVVRHGQTDWNVLGKLQGSDVDTHLNAFGRSQVAATAVALAPCVTHAHLLYCSTLQRARQTMAALLKATHHGHGHGHSNGHAHTKAHANGHANGHVHAHAHTHSLSHADAKHAHGTAAAAATVAAGAGTTGLASAGDDDAAFLQHSAVVYDKRLMEQAMGAMSGWTHAQKEAHVAAHRVQRDAYLKRKADAKVKADVAAAKQAEAEVEVEEVSADPFATIAGAESIPALEARIHEWLAHVVDAAKAKAKAHAHAHAHAQPHTTDPPPQPRTVRVVCVAHGMLIRHLLLCALGPERGRPTHTRGQMIGRNEENCHVTVLQYDSHHPTATTTATAAGAGAGAGASAVAGGGGGGGGGWTQLLRSTNLHMSSHAAAHRTPALSDAEMAAAHQRTTDAVAALYQVLNTGAPDLPPAT